ncbi:MAG: DEAD/DEAH box helicase [Myxococcota bacterium]
MSESDANEVPATEAAPQAPEAPADPFEGVPAPVRTALEKRGFTSLTAVQQAVLAQDGVGRDLRISSQTGSGKTVALGLALGQAFLDDSHGRLPRRLDGPRAIVIAPTRELATQVRDELSWLLAEIQGVRVECVVGGTDMRGDHRMLRNPPAVLVGTPGRMLDHIRTESLSCAEVHTVALDEADRMLDMGFREELESIIDALPPQRRSHLVSATFAGQVLKIADRFQQDAAHVEGTQLGRANEDIEHVVQLVDYNQRYEALVNALLLTLGEQVLVFVNKRIGASELAEELSEDGFAALPFSGDLSQAQRTRTLSAFRNGTIQVLVSTDVAARGIDVPDIAMVVHMTPPQDPDDYTHRSGRTGRAGRTGRSLLLVPPRAQHFVRQLLRAAKVEPSWQSVPSPSKVRKTITKNVRRDLHARMDADETPDEKTMVYAASILEKRDPTLLVATLLQMAEPRLPREPMLARALEPEPPRNDDRRGTGRRWDRGGRRPGGRPHKRKFSKGRHRN